MIVVDDASSKTGENILDSLFIDRFHEYSYTAGGRAIGWAAAAAAASDSQETHSGTDRSAKTRTVSSKKQVEQTPTDKRLELAHHVRIPLVLLVPLSHFRTAPAQRKEWFSVSLTD